MKRLIACVLACALVTGLSVQIASAQTPRKITATSAVTDTFPPGQFAKTTNKPNEKLKADVAKLVAETKAGKRSVLPSTQFPPPHRNNLSKTAKIAIIAGVALVVIALIVWKSFDFECESRCVL